jgi:hypothetical protein
VHPPGKPSGITLGEPARAALLRHVAAGDTVRFWRGVNRPPLKEETHKACAARFVEWLLRRYPDTAGFWIAARDIKDHLLEEFQRECGDLGSYVWMARGLSEVMDAKRVSDFIDCNGDRRCMAEYKVPAAVAAGARGDRRRPCAFAPAHSLKGIGVRSEQPGV